MAPEVLFEKELALLLRVLRRRRNSAWALGAAAFVIALAGLGFAAAWGLEVAWGIESVRYRAWPVWLGGGVVAALLVGWTAAHLRDPGADVWCRRIDLAQRWDDRLTTARMVIAERRMRSDEEGEGGLPGMLIRDVLERMRSGDPGPIERWRGLSPLVAATLGCALSAICWWSLRVPPEARGTSLTRRGVDVPAREKDEERRKKGEKAGSKTGPKRVRRAKGGAGGGGGGKGNGRGSAAPVRPPRPVPRPAAGKPAGGRGPGKPPLGSMPRRSPVQLVKKDVTGHVSPSGRKIDDVLRLTPAGNRPGGSVPLDPAMLRRLRRLAAEAVETEKVSAAERLLVRRYFEWLRTR